MGEPRYRLAVAPPSSTVPSPDLSRNDGTPGGRTERYPFNCRSSFSLVLPEPGQAAQNTVAVPLLPHTDEGRPTVSCPGLGRVEQHLLAAPDDVQKPVVVKRHAQRWSLRASIH